MFVFYHNLDKDNDKRCVAYVKSKSLIIALILIHYDSPCILAECILLFLKRLKYSVPIWRRTSKPYIINYKKKKSTSQKYEKVIKLAVRSSITFFSFY
jgi:hypothetical protein